ncbi:contact-dependent growth inhibition system immunity protein [Mucilaginibacter flavus]|uniref:contact-dependent growth inhibition system immunity protein n=1 Tax=Mucilaginibacter flavus TaxID=931504 RepID=UPI0025B4DCE9|nr:contact-dependent growth inhibition system immunity protein [Mucilaginibacter flavus]MDN3582222.1 contact-dependent growth inhibition system immunity protein [Mucilaginibacter flavus]
MKLENNWRFKSLQNLEKIDVPNSTAGASHLVKRSLTLLSTPLNKYTTEDLRLMIGQGLGLPYLVPLAIEKLGEDLFAEGDYYPGDLLSNVLNVGNSFWINNAELRSEVVNLIRHKKIELLESEIKLGSFEID